MAKVKMIVAIPAVIAQNIATQAITGFDTLPQLHPKLKETLREYMSEFVGGEGLPMAGLSRYEGLPVNLADVGSDVVNFLPARANSVLFEVHMPTDMVISVSFAELLDTNERLNENDEGMWDYILDMFRDKLTVGYDAEGEDLLSFVPFIDHSKCKFYALLSKDWRLEDFHVPGVEPVKVARMEVF